MVVLGFAPGVPRTVALSFGLTLTLQPVSHVLSKALVASYRAKPLKQTEWNTRIVSTLHAILVSVLSAYLLLQDVSMWRDMSYDSPLASHTVAIITGYLMGDLLLVLLSLKPWGKGNISSPVDTCIHHVFGVLSFGACIYVRASFVYCLMFIFTEVSTPFVNLRWMLHECDLADSKAYMATGVLMVLSFFLARILLLPLQWYVVLTNLGTTIELGGPYYAGQAMCGLVAVTCLNTLWFSKMLKGLRKLMRKKGQQEDASPSHAKSA